MYDHRRLVLTHEQLSFFLTLLFIPLTTPVDAFEHGYDHTHNFVNTHNGHSHMGMINMNVDNIILPIDNMDFTASPTSSTFSSSPPSSPSLSPIQSSLSLSSQSAALDALSIPFDLSATSTSAYDSVYENCNTLIDDKSSMIFNQDFYQQFENTNNNNQGCNGNNDNEFGSTISILAQNNNLASTISSSSAASADSVSSLSSVSAMVAAAAAAIALPIVTKIEEGTSPNSTSNSDASNANNRNRTKENARKRKLQVALANAARLDADSKRLDRLQRNRASAQLSRERKKTYLHMLEHQVQELLKANADLSAQLQKLHEEKERERERQQVQFPHGAPYSQNDFLIA